MAGEQSVFPVVGDGPVAVQGNGGDVPDAGRAAQHTEADPHEAQLPAQPPTPPARQFLHQAQWHHQGCQQHTRHCCAGHEVVGHSVEALTRRMVAGTSRFRREVAMVSSTSGVRTRMRMVKMEKGSQPLSVVAPTSVEAPEEVLAVEVWVPMLAWHCPCGAGAQRRRHARDRGSAPLCSRTRALAPLPGRLLPRPGSPRRASPRRPPPPSTPRPAHAAPLGSRSRLRPPPLTPIAGGCGEDKDEASRRGCGQRPAPPRPSRTAPTAALGRGRCPSAESRSGVARGGAFAGVSPQPPRRRTPPLPAAREVADTASP